LLLNIAPTLANTATTVHWHQQYWTQCGTIGSNWTQHDDIGPVCFPVLFASIGAGTNLKVGGTSPARKLGYFLIAPLHFLALKVQLVVLVSTFVTVSTVWSVSCLLFFYSRAPVPYGVGATDCSYKSRFLVLWRMRLYNVTDALG